VSHYHRGAHRLDLPLAKGPPMQCPRCSAENPERARFCEDCGAQLEFRCPHCGAAATPGKKFCRTCGRSLVGTPAHSRPAPSPQDYTPQHLAERIISSRGALEGERKQVTVLFADLKGSMELLADRDPEEYRRIRDPVRERMIEAVHRYEGFVNQVMGDGIMALFGAPIAHEDHAVRACYAALRMQEKVREHADEVRWSLGVPIQIRVGLNSGEVVVRSIGSDLRMDYTAEGLTTDLAARMEQVAEPGSVLLAPATLRLAEGYIDVKTHRRREIKGLSEPIEVHELIGTGMARSRLQVAAARGFTRFVGRDAELQVLRQTLERAGSGHGQIVALVGEPGVGKSRLSWEFTHSHRVQDWLTLEASSVSYGQATSYLPLIDLVQGYCGIEHQDDHRRMRERLTGKLITLDPTLQLALPALQAMLGIPVDDAQWDALDPPLRRQRTLYGCRRLLERESQEQPLLLIFEDLHWIDSETQAFLDSLADWLPRHPILLLVNYRPEYEHGWGRKTYYQQLKLDPLSPETAEELLRALLGDDEALQPLKRMLIERTDGNPFFLEESVWALVETGVLAGDRGAYRLARPIESIKALVPASVRAVLHARIDRLAGDDKGLLQAAAVVGKDVPFALLQAIAGLPEGAVCRGLANLQAAEFVYETSLYPDLEYTFKHTLTREVGYESLLQERRRALHAQIVDAYETLYPDRSSEHAERLAYHAFNGEVWDKAVGYSREAGQKAAGHSAYKEAVTYFRQALVALANLPPSRELKEQAIDLRVDLRNALLPIGGHGEVIDYLDEAETLAEALEDQRRLGLVTAYKSFYWWWRGDHEAADQAGDRALGIAKQIEDRAIEVLTNFYRGHAYHDLGNYAQATKHLRKNLEILQGDLARERFGLLAPASIASTTWMIRSLAETGEFAKGISLGEAAEETAREVNQPFSRIMSYVHLGVLYLQKGELEEAISRLARALELSESMSIPFFIPMAKSALGYAFALDRRVDEGRSMLEQALKLGESQQQRGGHSLWFAWLGEADLLAGEVYAAVQHGKSASELAERNNERGNQAWALRLRGEIAKASDPPDFSGSENHFRQALSLAQELHMGPLEAHCRLGLSTVHRQTGQVDEARREWTEAMEAYREMKMTFWIQRAQEAWGNE
jgi:class 3 adenylate cyclase/tetratricopeptide (TPR) repeat protein